MNQKAMSRDFRKLSVWAKSHQLVLDCYQATLDLPKKELFGLSSQIRRSAASIPANIAEGCGRGGNELVRFCRISMGSASELEYHLLLARDLNFLQSQTHESLDLQVTEVKRMLTSFIEKLTAES